jgi:acetolactate decarboxylase
MNIIKQGDFTGTIDLQDLENINHLFAMGPLEGLKGEITINDGELSISTLTLDKKQKYVSSFKYKAIFLVYGSAKEWQEIVIDKDLNSLTEIEQFVKESAVKHNLPLNKAFPFKIKGLSKNITYHIIYKQDNKPHNKKEHQRSKVKFSKIKENNTIIGFWSDVEGEGVYTHPNKRTHIHYISETSKDSGHIDAIELNSGAVLFIPKPNK